MERRTATTEQNKRERVIEVVNLVRRFGDTVAVDDLSISVCRGEILGLVGPDGAGKTTTLRLLATIMNPTSGRASVLGHDTVRRSRQIKQHIGYMAQRFTLYEDLTVLENLSFYANVYGVRGDRRRQQIERLLGFSRMSEFGHRRAGQLSGGMQKKLALACALIHDPQIVLLDEPTTGVDPVSRREFWDMLAELHMDGVTIVVCTPYMDEAERCSRVGLMYEGRLLACDSPARLKASIDHDLLAIWPDDIRRAHNALLDVDLIHEIQTYGDQLRVFVQDADTAMPHVTAALQATGVAVREVRPAPVRMEEVFISLIRRAHDHHGMSSDKDHPPPAGV
ncbi:MAG TPA: ABC transporter ATP-binding protein [Chloroflexi bacterium]|jgi:ABC-2 type transport system ATP-binding protein|nr:ABC transporter ATP-binding protein [Chloroflexota bacterium]